jgi:hypothetical protein
MPKLSFNASGQLAESVKRLAALRRRTVSEVLAEAVHNGLRSEQPGNLLGCCAHLSLPGKPYDPSAAVIPLRNWKILGS